MSKLQLGPFETWALVAPGIKKIIQEEGVNESEVVSQIDIWSVYLFVCANDYDGLKNYINSECENSRSRDQQEEL